MRAFLPTFSDGQTVACVLIPKAAERKYCSRKLNRLRRSFFALLSILMFSAATTKAVAYTPDSPLVVDMVDRGIAFLENPSKPNGGGISTGAEGEQILIAYTHHKVRQDPDHALVKRGVAVAQHMATRAAQQGLWNESEITYQASVAILLLIDVDPVKYRSQIQALGRALVNVQKPHGGFGYLNEQLGDISQTQYCVLALWTLDQAQFEVPRPAMDRAIQYLLRTQDPTGQWGYKGVDSGGLGKLVPQDERKSHSLTVAGAGSVLIGCDFFGLWRGSREASPDIEDFPPALKEQKNLAELKAKQEAFKITAEQIKPFINRTEDFLTRQPYQRPQGQSWHYYYLYTLERYRSFLEVANGKQEKEPDWYNQVVEKLRDSQAPSGGWAAGTQDPSYSNSGISTSFAILFLIRSTKKAIGDLNEGMLAGGYDLPDDTREIQVQGTQIKAKPVVTAVTDLLSLLEGDDPNNLEKGSIPENLKLATDPEERKKQISRLERLARGSQSWQARRVATRLLGQSDSLAVVPTLIFALTDNDKVVRIYARDGLRFISRKIDGFGMPRDPTPQEIEDAVKKWQAWYNSLDPGYVFLE